MEYDITLQLQLSNAAATDNAFVRRVEPYRNWRSRRLPATEAPTL
jgi:hypothetical protein